MEKFRLYNKEHGYKCRVNRQELAFLFGIADGLTVDEINAELSAIGAGYYITL